jgi:hypothetical protein
MKLGSRYSYFFFNACFLDIIALWSQTLNLPSNALARENQRSSGRENGIS